MLSIIHSDPLRGGFKRGMQLTADAAAATIGPCARRMVVGDPLAPLRVARTGLAVAMSLHFEDQAEASGVALLRQVGEWAWATAGDGTASAIVVAHLILRESINSVSIGFDPHRLRRGIGAALDEADQHLALLARPVGGRHELRQVAASAALDADLGLLVEDAANQAGAGNLIVVEAAQGEEIRCHTTLGIHIAAGCVMPRLVTPEGRNQHRHRFDRPLVLVMRGALESDRGLAQILEHARRVQRPLLVAAEHISGSVAIALFQRARASGLRVLAVQVPQDLDGAAAKLTHLVQLTGATVCDSAAGETPVARQLGEAGTVMASSSRTLILPPAPSCYDPPDRRGRDTIAVLRVPLRDGDGGDMRVRAERAVNAIHAAALHGVVPGGGVALLSAANALAGIGCTVPDGEARLAYSIVQRALEEPFRRLAENAGIAPTTAMRRVHSRDDLDFAGLSLPSGEVINVVRAGLIDPLSVPQGALHAAARAARLLLTTEGDPDHEEESAAPRLRAV